MSLGLLFLAFSVAALATEAKTAQYRSEHHLSSHYKATDSSAEYRLKAHSALPVTPVRFDAPDFHSELIVASLDAVRPAAKPSSPSHPLRAPPTF